MGTIITFSIADLLMLMIVTSTLTWSFIWFIQTFFSVWSRVSHPKITSYYYRVALSLFVAWVCFVLGTLIAIILSYKFIRYDMDW